MKRKQTKWEQIIDTVKKTAEKLPGLKKEFDDRKTFFCFSCSSRVAWSGGRRMIVMMIILSSSHHKISGRHKARPTVEWREELKIRDKAKQLEGLVQVMMRVIMIMNHDAS